MAKSLSLSSEQHAAPSRAGEPARREAWGPERSPDAGSRTPALLLGAFCVAVAVALQLARQPGASWGVLWAEDGGVFLSDSYNQSFFGALGEPYGSYLHIVPRLIFYAIGRFPLEHAALLTTVSAAAVVALLAAYVYHLSAAVFDTRWARIVLAASIVLLPAAGYETNATVINLHWYLIFASFWVFVAHLRSRRSIAFGALVVAASVMSDPLVGLMLPLAFLGFLRTREASALVVPGVLLAGLIVQYAVATSQQPLGEVPHELSALPSIYALRVSGSFVVGDEFLGRFWDQFGYPFAYSTLALVLGFCLFGAIRGDRGTRYFVGACLLLSFALHCAPLWLRGTAGFLDAPSFNLNGSRYFLVPILLMTAAVLKVLDFHVSARREAGEPLVRWRTVQAAFTVYAAALILTSFSPFHVREGGPYWKKGLAQARDECRGRGGQPPAAPASVFVPVAPPVSPPPFNVRLDCERLR